MASVQPSEKLSLSTRMLYGSGTIAFGVKDQGFNALLMLFYNQVIGLPAAWVCSAIMIAMIADAIFDPMLGQYSDNIRTRWGRRYPFMYAAALPIATFYLLLWSPPQLSDSGTFAWLATSAILVRFAISLYEIPSTALLAEFTNDYDERTKLVAARYFFGVCGDILMTIITFGYFLKPSASQPVGHLNASGYSAYAWAAAADYGRRRPHLFLWHPETRLDAAEPAARHQIAFLHYAQGNGARDDPSGLYFHFAGQPVFCGRRGAKPFTTGLFRHLFLGIIRRANRHHGVVHHHWYHLGFCPRAALIRAIWEKACGHHHVFTGDARHGHGLDTAPVGAFPGQ